MQSDKFKGLKSKIEEFFAENRIIDEFSKLSSGALGAALGAKKELEDKIKLTFEALFHKLDLVTREEHEVLKMRLEKLEQKITELEEK